MFCQSRAPGGKPTSNGLALRGGKCRAATWAILLSVGSLATGQTTDTSAIDTYLKAITQTEVSSRLAALERFASSDTNSSLAASSLAASSLRLDALQWIVWDEKQTHNDAAAANWARRLLHADTGNALALAVIAEAARRNSEPATVYLALAQQGTRNLARLRRPEGMSHDAFLQLQSQAAAMLQAATGLGELDRNNFSAARAALAKAVEASPLDAQLVYALALADLSGENPDRRQGYWLLARAVNLAGGPAVARQIEEFGRKKYKADGGSDRDWNQFLAVTAAHGASAAEAIATAQPPPAGRPSSANPAEIRTAENSRREASSRRRASKTRTNPGNSTRSEQAATKLGRQQIAALGPGKEAKPSKETAAANSLPPISGPEASGETLAARAGPRGEKPRGEKPPLSLGILIETSIARKGTRQAILYSLSDLVRRLGAQDEAFILSFSHDLVFEEDLTGDASRLEQALDQIKPHPGTALLDAVGFAAGHLRRIASNQARILLLISDGRNANSRIPASASSAEIRASGVRIYCIGVEVSASDSRYRLQGLASGTGGTASFISAPEQFRAAAAQFAGQIGIPFQF